MLERAAAAAFLSACLGGCHGGSNVTTARLEAAIAPTFANLVERQIDALGLAPVSAAALRVRASCRKLGVDGTSTGPGDWTCSIVWAGPDRQGGFTGTRAPMQDAYDVAVGADGCYTATAGAESHLGGPTLRGAGGKAVASLVYAFDGCFDTSH